MSGYIEAARQIGRAAAMINLRADYVYGRIDIEEFERKVGALFGVECRHDWLDITRLGGTGTRICSLCGERIEV